MSNYLYLLFLPLFYAVYLGCFVGKTQTVKDAFLDVVDSLPVVLLPFLTLNKSVYIFIIGCIFANVLMRPSTYIGAGLYLLVYGFAGIITALNVDFNIVKLLIAISIITAILIPVAIKIKKPLVIAGAAAYAYIALASCLYAFMLTWNIGFLALVIGDLTLIFYLLGIYKKEWFHYLSNCIFYTGVILTPLFLQTLGF